MRLFIALPLQRTVESRLGEIIEHLRAANDPIRWVAPHNIHLTVRFLGETDPRLVDPLAELIKQVSSNCSVISCRLSRLGAFPNLKRPRVLWAGLDGEAEKLSALAAKIEQGARSLGFSAEEKAFKPHLTLGRAKRDGRLTRVPELIDRMEIEPIDVQLDRLVLFESTLTPQGANYRRLADVSLQERFDA